MTVKGQCNCKSITVELPAAPNGCAVCYCSNCQRSSAGLCSINYLFEKAEIKINDPNNYLKSYQDIDTKSGNPIFRNFCSNCGSPVVTGLGPEATKIIVKGGLFDEIPTPVYESFPENRRAWMKLVKPEDADK